MKGLLSGDYDDTEKNLRNLTPWGTNYPRRGVYGRVIPSHSEYDVSRESHVGLFCVIVALFNLLILEDVCT